MEELQPEELQELVQELEGESEEEEVLSPEVEGLLRDLQSGTRYLARSDAAEQLGKVGTSSPRIVRALLRAYESDPYRLVKWAAAESLRAPVHQQYLQERPDLMEATERTLWQPADPASDVPAAGSESERVLVQVEDETSRHEWRTARLALEPAAGTITINECREGGPTLSIPLSEIASCEIVAIEEVTDRADRRYDPGPDLVGCLLVGFIALVERSVFKASLVPAIKLTQSMSDGARQQRVVHLRSVEEDRGQGGTAEMALRIAGFLRQSGYQGVIPDELIEPTEFRAWLGEKRKGRLLPWVAVLSSLAGLAVGWVIGLWQANQSLWHGGGLGCGTGFLVAVAVGAVVGVGVAAVIGAAVHGLKDAIPGMIIGAISAAVVAAVSWWPISVLRVVQLGGP